MEYFLGKAKKFFIPSEENGYSSRFLQGNWLLAFVILVLFLKLTAVLFSVQFPPNIFFADITKSALESFVNQTRQSLGLSPLVENVQLNLAAQLKAENMVQNQYFSHTSPTGITPWFWFAQADYKYQFAGENLAIGFFESEEVYTAWLNSPDHRANIINPNYTEFGTAVLGGFGQNNTFIVVQEFGSRQPKKAVSVSIPNTTSSSPEPVTTPENQTTVVSPISAPIQGEQVLSQATIPHISRISEANDSPFLKFLNAIIYDRYDLLQNFIYGVSLLIIGVLLVLIFFSPKKELILRAVLIVAILLTAIAIDRETVVALIPHQVAI